MEYAIPAWTILSDNVKKSENTQLQCLWKYTDDIHLLQQLKWYVISFHSGSGRELCCLEFIRQKVKEEVDNRTSCSNHLYVLH